MIHKILLVEDSDYKIVPIKSFIEEVSPESVLTIARSFQSGLKRLNTEDYGLIILDMTLPSFDKSSIESGGRMRHIGGLDLFKNMLAMGKHENTIFITHHDSFRLERGVIGIEDIRSLIDNELEEYDISEKKYKLFKFDEHQNWKAEIENKIR